MLREMHRQVNACILQQMLTVILPPPVGERGEENAFVVPPRSLPLSLKTG
jgi:hypothetical protein